ncbi:uncharacterized protein LOC106670957 [Cimex lectularius]|uniref:CHK kinase-like domain-containing protein n=1 Tax=Cimex lectularius TaxID=79782 RepID=A0A8I6S2U1_CIMLE|nr:uncharacterized protein LOC106670957 [Cimex lectularius]
MAYINESDCLQVLQAKLGFNDFELDDYKLVPFEEIRGFHGSHALLKIHATVEGEKRAFSFFVKSAANNELVFERYWSRAKLFAKEHLMLTKIIKDLQKQIPRKLTADCYLSKLNQFVVMENLSLVGYDTANIKDMDMPHAEAAIRTFADFHAASIIFEEKNGLTFRDKYKDISFESFFRFDPERTECLLYSADKGVRDVVEKYFQDLDQKIINDVLDKAAAAAERLAKPSGKYRNVICQGDPWGNNLLYKYKNGNPSEAIVVDFQAQRYAPPALEIQQFLHLGASTEFVIKHGEEVKNIYYDQMTKTLKHQNIDVARILPRDVFEESYRYYEEFGIATRLYYALLTKIPGEYLLKLAADEKEFLSLMVDGTSSVPLEAFEKHSRYRQTLTEAINGAIKFYETHI